MKRYFEMKADELKAELEKELKDYEYLKTKELNLDMSRGKPAKEQLDAINDILGLVIEPEECIDDGVDCRNYGALLGLSSCRRLWADILGIDEVNVFACGSSSLSLMFDIITKAWTHGLLHSKKPWSKERHVRFLCPAPGYDRHFKILEYYGIEMITVPMNSDGPDMDFVEEKVKDKFVKGIWCVPKYSNPTGIIYSDRVINRLAKLKPAAPDFTIMWDNAYCVHEFACEFKPFVEMLSLAESYGNPDMVIEFASTSKITMAGSGIACIAASVPNIQYLSKLYKPQVICYDLANQLRHVKYLKNKEHTLEVMKKHAEIVKPKFDKVIEILEKELGEAGIARWSNPVGGYFISFDAIDGTAKEIEKLCFDAGVKLTPAGATYPHGFDPKDSNIRIAPTVPSLKELEDAMTIFAHAVKIATLEKLIG